MGGKTVMVIFMETKEIPQKRTQVMIAGNALYF
jgi:hypothetical protein